MSFIRTFSVLGAPRVGWTASVLAARQGVLQLDVMVAANCLAGQAG
jgi:hypothetical protein